MKTEEIRKEDNRFLFILAQKTEVQCRRAESIELLLSSETEHVASNGYLEATRAARIPYLVSDQM